MKKYHPKILTHKTIQHYADNPIGFWEGTKDHDVSQNIRALLDNIQRKKPFKILDFGCGPGRDLLVFKDLGHMAFGLDGCEEFCHMATKLSNCQVFHQDFINLDLEEDFFDGIFANASLFHVPKEKLSTLLKSLHVCLATDGILFSSNPRGHGEDFTGTRYANFMELDEYKEIVEREGFELIDHYYRPKGRPVEQCPWLACIFRKVSK
ncbi:SAM-dependent methyltransferase [Halobacteriovorax marinus]|uniref:SAM-dependent methyltransferase n=1 Tax=Halobacteriovorax marinus TaxID=97084 RepID=A0A1Y5F468_9BACT|nr:SAM-dependent methyltransferase [Halobacteriovorax marinus]